MSLSPGEAEGFVLAGGTSSRMGQDKALVQLAGRPLIQHAIEILRSAGLEARIAGSREELSSFAETIPDQSGRSLLGPLSGICAALSASKCRFAVFLPVDLPLIPPGLIQYLVQHAVTTNSLVTIVSVASFIQTFPAVIDRAALPTLDLRLGSGDRNCLRAFRSAALSMGRPFTALPIERLVEAGLAPHPSNLIPAQWFLNVNAPAELSVAEAALSGFDPVK